MTNRLPLLAFAIILGLLVFLVGSSGDLRHGFADRGEKFYYFNPDSPQSNMSRLKVEMDSFLKEANFAFSFTPFARFSDFDRLSKVVPPNFVLLPQWYFEENREKMQFIPLLIPTRNGTTSYRKLLLTSKNSDTTLSTLSKRTIAMTFLGTDGYSGLGKLLLAQHHINVNDVNIIVTPKDSDALFALVLGQVDMALVSEENLASIGKVNPIISESVRTLTETIPISLPVLCYRKGTITLEKVEEMKKLFLGSNKKAVAIMDILQFDGWQEYYN
nr:PhnD/SsuA/transferrin family substrate-binding protein [Desulfobulbaceae bacterium]